MVTPNVNIVLTVKAFQSETSNYVSLFFERPRGFRFEAGDWVDIDLPKDNLAGGKVYSLTSSPNEPDLRITFRRGITPFKKALENLKSGAKVTLTQYGNDYGFQLRNNRSSVLIAGGVGITPFRSMVSEMADEKSNNIVKLIYMSTSNFLFRDELELWASQLTNFTLELVNTGELKRKEREKLLTALIAETSQQYYISGPTGMVNSTLSLLDKLGVSRKDIKIDDFGTF